MKYAKIIRFDKSDLNIFPQIAEEGELAVVGSFSFFNLNEENLNGKIKQAFSNAFMGIPSFGYSTFITITEVKEDEIEQLKLVYKGVLKSPIWATYDYFCEKYFGPVILRRVKGVICVTNEIAKFQSQRIGNKYNNLVDGLAQRAIKN